VETGEGKKIRTESGIESPVPAHFAFGAGWEAHAELSTQDQALGGCLGAVNRPNCRVQLRQPALFTLRREEHTGHQVSSCLALCTSGDSLKRGGRNPVCFSGFSALNLVSWAAPFAS
jgi:hypothetical protein